MNYLSGFTPRNLPRPKTSDTIRTLLPTTTTTRIATTSPVFSSHKGQRNRIDNRRRRNSQDQIRYVSAQRHKSSYFYLEVVVLANQNLPKEGKKVCRLWKSNKKSLTNSKSYSTVHSFYSIPPLSSLNLFGFCFCSTQSKISSEHTLFALSHNSCWTSKPEHIVK